MSTFLVNASNLKVGGGLQVADSICRQLNLFKNHRFVVVLSSYLNNTRTRIEGYENVKVVTYDIPNTVGTILLGVDRFLDNLVMTNNVRGVLTVFGPSRWRPRIPHLSGFALPQMIIPESPYFTRMGNVEKLKWKCWRWIRKQSLKRSAKVFWTENPYISERLERFLGRVEVHTVSNYYNQVFDNPEMWNLHPLDAFAGITCLSVSSYYAHKNFPILVEATKILIEKHPEFMIRFVLTFDEGMINVPDNLKKHFVFTGKVDVSECPDLYRQCDIMVMPTLLECFTATYPEAMRMRKPIVTTDMDFAKGLCGDAACYYSAVDAVACSDAIYKVATDKAYAALLVERGRQQLAKFDSYEKRAEKLIGLLEEMTGQ